MNSPTTSTLTPPSPDERATDRRHPRYRVAIVSGHPTQWEGPLFARLARHEALDIHVYYRSREGLGAAPDAEIGVVFDWDTPVLEGYQHSFLDRPPSGLIAFARALARERYDAVIVEGHDEWPMRVGILTSLMAGVPVIHRLDSELRAEHGAKGLLKRRLLPLLFGRMRAFLPLSSLAVQYLETHGVPRDRIFLAPYTVDNDWYAAVCADWRQKRDVARAELRIARDAVVAVAVLRFVDRERPLDFVAAAEALQRQNQEVVFLLVGDGPQRAEIEQRIHTARSGRVILPGFRPLSDLPRFYAVADMFVHPGVRECWGLSVNEAMACGLPVIVSDRVGAGHDLVRHGENGLRYPAGDVEALASCMAQLAHDSERRRAMGQSASARISTWSYERSIGSILDAVRFSCRTQHDDSQTS